MALNLLFAIKMNYECWLGLKIIIINPNWFSISLLSFYFAQNQQTIQFQIQATFNPENPAKTAKKRKPQRSLLKQN